MEVKTALIRKILVKIKYQSPIVCEQRLSSKGGKTLLNLVSHHCLAIREFVEEKPLRFGH